MSFEAVNTVAQITTPAVDATVLPVQQDFVQIKKTDTKLQSKGIYIQPKLTVGAPDDPYEKEADAVADKVMRMPEQNFVQRKCADCEKNEKLQRKPVSESITPLIQTKSEGNATVSKVTADAIHSSKGSGGALDSNTQSFMSSRFGTDFSNVKIHTGSYAVQMSRELNAQAFTVGSDIYFNSGKYNPQSDTGKHLLAHELTHIVQQGQEIKQVQRAPAADKKQEYISTLKTTYSVKDVVDTDVAFSADELKIVIDAFAKVPAADISAINGIILKRISSGPDAVTAAIYSVYQSVSETAVKDEHYISVTNEAYMKMKAPEAQRAIIHEVGHAVAKMAIKKAVGELYTATLPANTAIREANKKVNEIKAFTDTTSETVRAAAYKEYYRLKGISDAKKTDQTAKEGLLAASYADIADLKDKAKLAKTDSETAFAAAATQLAVRDGVVDNYVKAVERTQAVLTAFYDTSVTPAPDPFDVNYDSNLKTATEGVLSVISTRNAEETSLRGKDKKNAAPVTLQPLITAQNQFSETSIFGANNKKMPKVVKLFYDFVLANGIVPTDAFSPYAKSTWPAKPGEFYAEAYSFFITDPAKLIGFSKPLYDWFASGKHK